MDEVTPLFICGVGRSGTTNTLRVLNSHPSVMLNGEISIAIQKQFFALLDTVERSYSDRDGTGESWNRRKVDYMFDSFGYLSKGGRGRLNKVAEARFRGHKTPRLEILFDTYEAQFGSVGMQPRYIYCARNPFDCWRSYRATSWSHHDLEKFMTQYTASFESLRGMQQQAAGRVTVVTLDALIAASDPIAFYEANLFAPLGLQIEKKSLVRIEKIGRERTASSHDPLSPEEMSLIAEFPGVAKIRKTMFPASATR